MGLWNSNNLEVTDTHVFSLNLNQEEDNGHSTKKEPHLPCQLFIPKMIY